MLKRFLAGIGVLGMFLALAVPAGISATPRQIYRDLADNGRLDHRYSAADLQRAFRNPTIQGYRKPTGPGPGGGHVTPPRPAPKTLGVLPFTGTDLTFMAVGALLLVVLGGGLRILVRTKR